RINANRIIRGHEGPRQESDQLCPTTPLHSSDAAHATRAVLPAAAATPFLSCDGLANRFFEFLPHYIKVERRRFKEQPIEISLARIVTVQLGQGFVNNHHLLALQGRKDLFAVVWIDFDS